MGRTIETWEGVSSLQDEELEDLTAYFEEVWGSEATIMAISAKKRKGIRNLAEFAINSLPFGPSLYPKDVLSEHPERFFIAEIIREQIFLRYREEVPYATQVVVTQCMERARGNKDYIEAEVIVDRESQKGILIGKGGAALKGTSSAARAELEAFLERKVYLQLRVKTKEGWRENDRILRGAGLLRNSTASESLAGEDLIKDED
ncbi:hypothetical protein CYMTET_10519 [Cymbomonas tetramitiformis]|uniref:KH type-2 domain-containing protein n=1 Tax=Cymbomonas tetramitiformis TaxID=36881 RepID=A0AAE0GPL0_9CHLO|nr:hypothetical protein CYMTET_10519 [Cymbomonas tetramitiformis]